MHGCQELIDCRIRARRGDLYRTSGKILHPAGESKVLSAFPNEPSEAYALDEPSHFDVKQRHSSEG